jgi:hypothetical protein
MLDGDTGDLVDRLGFDERQRQAVQLCERVGCPA